MSGSGETNVFLCKWKKTPGGYRLWVKGSPEVFGEAASFGDAEQALTDAIWSAAEDLDVVIPTVLEFDPPLPPAAVAEPFLKPELFLISGDGIFEIDTHLDDPAPAEDRNAKKERAIRELTGLYSGGVCEACRHVVGKRTEKNVPIRSYDVGYDGGFLRHCIGPIWVYGRVFSDRFLSLLRTDETANLRFRPLTFSGKRPRRKYYEHVSESKVPFVAVKGFDAGGWECHRCGRRTISIREPILDLPETGIHYFVCRDDLPDPLPSCFPVGPPDDVRFCMTRQRWDEIRGQKGTKGITSARLGVISAEQCDRQPRLWSAFTPCKLCSQWPEPVTIDGQQRAVWDLPANTCSGDAYSRRNLQWLQAAAEAELIRIMRSTIMFEEMDALIDSGRKPRQPEFITFRCPECWRLGRIVCGPRELWCNWP